MASETKEAAVNLEEKTQQHKADEELGAEHEKPVYLERSLQPAAETVQLKEVALSLFDFLVDAAVEASEEDLGDQLGVAMSEISELLCSLPARSLFEEWSPPQRVQHDLLALAADCASASTTSSSHPAKDALGPGQSTYWLATGSKADTYYAVDLKKPTFVTEISLKYYYGGSSSYSSRYHPASFEVQISHDTKPTAEEIDALAAENKVPPETNWETVRTVTLEKEAKAGVQEPMRVAINKEVQQIRLFNHGFQTSSAYNHALATFEAFVPATDVLSSSVADTLAKLQQLLITCTGSSVDSIASDALQGLFGLMQSSASLKTVLQLIQTLTAVPSLTAGMTSYAEGLLAAMSEWCDEALEAAMGNAVNPTAGAGVARAAKAAFDPDAKTDFLELKDDNQTVKFPASRSSSSAHCLVNVGCKSGRASWEFKCVKDNRGDEYCFYGMATKPITSSSASSSSSLWMVEGYNGACHNAGRNIKTACKIHEGQRIKFELDIEEGQCKMFVDDEDKGVVFKDLPKDKEFFPAIVMTHSNREVKLLSCDVAGGVDIAGTTPLAELEEIDVDGCFATGGLMFDSTDNSSICGVTSPFNLALYPSDADDGRVAYDVEELEHETLVGYLGVDDTSGSDAAPVTLSVIGDGEVLWTSSPMQQPGSTKFFRVFITGISNLELHAKVLPGSDPESEPAKLILMTPRIHAERDWLWAGDAKGNSGSASLSFSTPQELAAVLLDRVALLATCTNKASAAAAALEARKSKDKQELQALPLEAPFCVQVSADTFSTLVAMIKQLLASEEGATAGSSAVTMARQLMKLMRANLDRLVNCHVDPREEGIVLYPKPSETATLKPVLALLDGIATSSTVKELQQDAAAVMDTGLTVLYPTTAERRALMRSLVQTGGTLDVQFKFPTLRVLTAKEKAAKEKDDTVEIDESDDRFERALLLLQAEADGRGWDYTLSGSWGGYLHLVVELPTTTGSSTVEFLDKGLGQIMKKAGFPEWDFPAGCSNPHIALKIERFLNTTVADREFTERATGYVRIFPSQAATYKDVCAHVDRFQSYLHKPSASRRVKKAKSSEAGAGAGAGAATAAAEAADASDSAEPKQRRRKARLPRR